MVENAKTKRGKIIADKIRKILYNADLRIVYANGEMKLALADYNLNAKLGDKKTYRRRALTAKARAECFNIYLKNVQRVKNETSVGVNEVLSRYNPRYQRIWVMYFLEKRTLEEICRETNYTLDGMNTIIKKLKLDMSDFYQKGGKR